MFHRHSSGSDTTMQPPGSYRLQQNRRVVAPTYMAQLHKTRKLPFNMDMDDRSDDKHGKGGQSNNKQAMLWRVLLCFVLTLLPWIPHQRKRWQVSSKRAVIDGMIEEQTRSIQMLDDTTERILILRKDVESLGKENELSFHELRRGGRTLPDDMESPGYEEEEAIEESLVKRIDKLESTIQASARKRLEQRYVEMRRFQVRFSPCKRDLPLAAFR
jgi:hypothetical protein